MSSSKGVGTDTNKVLSEFITKMFGEPNKIYNAESKNTEDWMYAYEGDNLQLSTQYHDYTLFDDQSTWMDELAPIQENTKGMRVQWKSIKFDAGYADIQAPQAATRFLTYGQTSGYANLTMRGIGVEMPAGFWFEPEGVSMFFKQLVRCSVAMNEGFLFNDMVELLDTEDALMDVIKSGGQSNKTIQRLLQDQCKYTGYLQKQKNAISKLIYEVEKHMATWGGRFDSVVINRNIRVHEELVPPENTDYFLNGKSKDYFRDLNVDKRMRFSIGEKNAYIMPEIRLAPIEPIDLLLRHHTVGGYAVLRSAFPFNDSEPYKSNVRDIAIMDISDKRTKVIIPFDTIARHAGIGIDVFKGNDFLGGGKARKLLQWYDKTPWFSGRKEKFSTSYLRNAFHLLMVNNVTANYKSIEGGARKMMQTGQISDVSHHDVLQVLADPDLEKTSVSINNVMTSKQKGVLFGIGNSKAMTKLIEFVSDTARVFTDLFGDAIKAFESTSKDKLIPSGAANLDTTQLYVAAIYAVLLGERLLKTSKFVQEYIGVLKAAGKDVSTLNEEDWEKYFWFFTPEYRDLQKMLLIRIDGKAEGFIGGVFKATKSLQSLFSKLFEQSEMKEMLGKLVHLNIRVPYDFILTREDQRLLGNGLMCLLGDNGTFQRFRKRQLATIGVDADRQWVRFHLSQGGGMVVTGKENLQVVQNVLIQDVVGGMGSVLYDPELDIENYSPNQNLYGRNNNSSIKVLAIPITDSLDNSKLPNPLDVTGYYRNMEIYGIDVDKTMLHYSTCKEYDNLWHWSKIVGEETHLDAYQRTMAGNLNTQCWLMYAETRSKPDGDFDIVQPETGHLEGLVYPGCLKHLIAGYMSHPSDYHDKFADSKRP